MNVLITGTSQGIGLELTKIALGEGHRVLAIARSETNSHELKGLASKHTDKLHVLYTDLSHSESINLITAAAKKLEVIDLLINNAGIYRQGETRQDFEENFLINSITPYLLTKALVPFLKKSPVPKCVHLSSIMGSIADNQSGGAYAYRASKAALNSIMKGMSIEEPWLASVCLHPGWVKTRMGTEAAPVKPVDSANGLWKIMTELTLKESGSFLDYRNQKLPW